jgi:TRAP-type C4-dicarboxylate transport system substrate-binding protein
MLGGNFFMKKLSVALVLSILFVSFIYVSLPSASLAADGPIKLNYSNFMPAPHKNSILSEAWSREIEKRTNGKIAISYFPGGTLTPAPQTYDSVVTGIADIGFSVFAYSRGKFPLMEVIDLPLGYKSGAQATELINAFYAKFQPKELADVKVLYLHAHGPGVLHSKAPIATLDAFKGKKIRATGLSAKIVTAFGGAPVGTTMPETYDALRTGVAEGAMAPLEALKGWKWGEVVSATTLNYGSAYSTGFFVIMNKQKWDALPADVQKIFTEVSAEYAAKQGKTWDEIDAEGLEFIKAKDFKVTALTPEEDAKWADKVKPLLDEYVANSKAKGLPGEEALKFCLDFLKK